MRVVFRSEGWSGDVSLAVDLRCVFFFQAEDGIRDLIVTGVQTCALPISCVWNLSSPSAHGYRSNRVIARPIALAQGESQPWTAAYTQPWLMLAGLSWSERDRKSVV